MPLSIKEYLLHILEEADFLFCHSARLDRDSFEQDEVLKRAFVRSDKLIHEYFGVDYEIVWDATPTKVPELAATARRILDEPSR